MPKIPPRKCKGCQKMFVPERLSRRYCSQKCGKNELHKVMINPPRTNKKKEDYEP